MGIRIERNFPIQHNAAVDFSDTIEVTIVADGDHGECLPDYTVVFSHASFGEIEIEVDYVLSEDTDLILGGDYVIKRSDMQRIALEMNFTRIMFEVGFNMQ